MTEQTIKNFNQLDNATLGTEDASCDDRDWLAQWQAYTKGIGPIPGPHPNPDHLWNKDREEFFRQKEKEINIMI